MWDALNAYEDYFGYEYPRNMCNSGNDEEKAEEIFMRIKNNDPAPKPEPLPDDARL